MIALLTIVAVIIAADALLLRDCVYYKVVRLGRQTLLTVGWSRFTWTVGITLAGCGVRWSDTRQVSVNIGPFGLTVDFLGG